MKTPCNHNDEIFSWDLIKLAAYTESLLCINIASAVVNRIRIYKTFASNDVELICADKIILIQLKKNENLTDESNIRQWTKTSLSICEAHARQEVNEHGWHVAA